jgi:hypothetical protein
MTNSSEKNIEKQSHQLSATASFSTGNPNRSEQAQNSDSAKLQLPFGSQHRHAPREGVPSQRDRSMNTHKVVLVCVVPHSSIHVLANDLCVTDLQWKTLPPINL